jgi:hypothetical protein
VSRLGTLGKHEFVDGRAVMLLSLATQLSIWLLDMFAKLATVDDERQEGYTKQFITLAMERFMDSSVPGVIDVFREAIEGDDNEGDDDVPNHTTGR